MEIQFRHIARAVIVHENKLLIARVKGAQQVHGSQRFQLRSMYNRIKNRPTYGMKYIHR